MSMSVSIQEHEVLREIVAYHMYYQQLAQKAPGTVDILLILSRWTSIRRALGIFGTVSACWSSLVLHFMHVH